MMKYSLVGDYEVSGEPPEIIFRLFINDTKYCTFKLYRHTA